MMIFVSEELEISKYVNIDGPDELVLTWWSWLKLRAWYRQTEDDEYPDWHAKRLYCLLPAPPEDGSSRRGKLDLEISWKKKKSTCVFFLVRKDVLGQVHQMEIKE